VAGRVSLSLRAKLALGFAIVAAVPLVGTQQVTSWSARRAFRGQLARALDDGSRLVEKHFRREGARVAHELESVLASVEVRAALLAHLAERRPGAAHADLIDAIGQAAERSGLALLSLHRADGTIVASAQEPTRFDVPDPRVLHLARTRPELPVLDREEGVAVEGLALRMVVPLEEAGQRLWLAGGVLVEPELATLPVGDAQVLLVVDADGVHVAPTPAGDVAAALVGDVGADVAAVRSTLEGAGYRVGRVALAGIVGDEPVALLLATSREPLEAALTRLRRIFAGALVGGLSLALALAYGLSRRWTDPVERLVRGLERVAQGDLESRVELERDDELGRLGQAFDAMTRDLAESRGRLLQAERVAAWQDIARRLAHEIKNPLSPIALSMETLRRSHAAGRDDFPELLSECTQTVLEEVERLRRIVQEFSDFARLPKPHLVEESLHDVIRGVIALYAGLGDRHRFTTDFEPGDGRFVFDPDQMNRLLVNLVKNAVEAMPEGGEVCISTRADRAAGRFVVRVADDGPGVAAATEPSLFHPYRSSKPGGTGLGLAIVDRIASEHGGRVWLESTTDGACFAVELPLDPPISTTTSEQTL